MKTGALFALLLGGVAACGVGGAASAQQKVTYAVATTNISTGHAAQSSIPRAMNYWQDQGVDVDVIGLSGATVGVQQVASGNVDFATVGVDALLNAAAKGIKVKAVYTYTRQPIYQIVAPKNGSISKIEDLKGKTIGIPDMTAGSVPFTRGLLRAVGLDPDKDVTWLAVGHGAPAANAFRRGDIDAWAAWDTIVASMENAGFELKQIAPDWSKNLPGNVIIATEDTVRDRPDLVVKLARGVAESTVFGLANPEGSVRKHWELYPETKPQGGSEEKALKDATHIFNARFNTMRIAPGLKWGENVPEQWDRIADMAKKDGTLPASFDVSKIYTNQFIDEINRFDPNGIAGAAKASSW
jgi:NitT/TauT family transport system substrate-binding protein